MQQALLVFPETLDPDDSKTYQYDWSKELGEGETVDSHVVTVISASGATKVSDGVAGSISQVKFTAGTPGERVIFTIRMTKSSGDVKELGFGIDILESTYVPADETEVETITRYIVEAKARRHSVALGEAVIDVWRDGRRMRMTVSSIEELNGYISQMENELAKATATAAGTPRRRAIGLMWKN